MSTGLSLEELIEYTDWERGLWHEWLRGHGDAALATSVGPHGDGRFKSVGEVVRHVFSAETRYVERLSGQPLSDVSAIPSDSVEALFALGGRSRAALRAYVAALPAGQWDAPFDLELLGRVLNVTRRKVVGHVLIHEVRHWAQIGTLFRLNGLKGEFHDFLFSPVLEPRRSQP